MKHAVKILPLALALAFVTNDAQALGLGALVVKSQLNQPLVAEIPLLGVPSGELETISVRLASPEAFERVGLPRPAGVTANLQFSVGRNARGEPVVRVTTSGRVDDPFVAFLLEAQWEKGSVVREFTALVDPPFIAAATVTPMTAPTVASTFVAPPMPVAAPAEPETLLPAPAPEPAPTPEPAPAPETAPASIAAAPTPEPAAPPPAIAAVPPPAPPLPAAMRVEVAHQVRAGDTLWSIAQKNRQDVTAAQMMLAIQRANPDAFLRDNINLLRRGAVLRIPTREEATDLARDEAEAQVREQMLAWRGAQPATTTAPTPAPVPSAIAARPADVDTAPPAAAAAGVSGARLEIAPPIGVGAKAAQSGAAAGGSGTELRAELDQAREDLSAREAELVELRSRMTEQEAIANEQKRLIELKDSQLSALEASLREQRTEDLEAPAATASDWLRHPAVLVGGGLLLVSGLVAWLLRRRRSDALKRALPSIPEASPASPRLSEDRDFLSSLSKPSPVDTAEPVEELSIPPGSFDEALMLDPIDAVAESSVAPVASVIGLDMSLDQLRHYYNTGDAAAFLRVAERMHAQVTTPADPRWREVVVMGMGLVPGHALFRELQWNPISAASVRSSPSDAQSEPTPVAAVAPVAPEAPEAPEAAEFSERETAERPVLDAGPSGEASLDDTRLELAQAYIEIGDTDGARDMLEEVLLEGSPSARAEAERLLKRIS